MAATSLRRFPAVFTGKICRYRGLQVPKMVSRAYAITGNTTADRAINAATGGRAEGWLNWYENSVGLTEVRGAQGKVVEVSPFNF